MENVAFVESVLFHNYLKEWEAYALLIKNYASILQILRKYKFLFFRGDENPADIRNPRLIDAQTRRILDVEWTRGRPVYYTVVTQLVDDESDIDDDYELKPYIVNENLHAMIKS